MIHLAGLVEASGSELRQLSRTIHVTATGGEFGVPDLNAAKQWLRDLGLATEQNEYYVLMPSLREAASDSYVSAALLILRESIDQLVAPGSPDLDSERLLLEADSAAASDPDLQRVSAYARERLDLVRTALVGEIGEEVVLTAARTELLDLGRADLATLVRRVSLESDHFGYDILAPRSGGLSDRLLEVKASTSVGEAVTINLTRNEVEVGLRESGWRLVVCEVTSVDERSGVVVGWCTIGELEPMLPTDNGDGRWQQVRMSVQVGSLRSDLPPAVV
jgi:hypothetical protein